MTDHFDFKYGRPVLSSNKQAIILGAVCNAIQHRFVTDPLVSRQQTREIDPCDYMPVLRRYTCDSIRVPDICEDISLDVFELIELINDLVSIPDGSPSNWIGANKIFRLAKPCCGRLVDAARQFCSTGSQSNGTRKEFGPKSRFEDSGPKEPCENARTGQCS